MTYNNIFAKYPELKPFFGFKKGFFKYFSVSFQNDPVSVMATFNFRLNGGHVAKFYSVRNGEKDVIREYLEHTNNILKQLGLLENEEVLDFVESTVSTMWSHYYYKYLIRKQFYDTKMSFEYVKVRHSESIVKLVDKFGDVIGISTYERKLSGVLCFGTLDKQNWVTGYLGNSNNLEKVIKNFCKIKELNDKQISYLRTWLKQVSVGT